MMTTELGACEWFVWDLQRSGLIDRGQLDQLVGEFLRGRPRAEPNALAEYLVEREVLTSFQAERILDGKTQGLVLGPYVLLEAIGAGSMGQVYKALSRSDQQLYALKVLPRRSMWNVRLARRQVRSFTQFSHPGVVPFVDVGTAGGLHYLVWPLADGETLESMVEREGKLSPEQVAQVGLQLAQALTASHQRDVFHGLLKPSNVLIDRQGKAKILDFGIGSLLAENEGESLVDTMSAANTLTSGLDCASPESIVEPTNRTPAGDQYSLGCVLYYCLAGHYPFPEGTTVEKMMAHQYREPQDIQALAPNAPKALVEIVRRLMQKVPESRYNGVDELMELLEPLASGARLPNARIRESAAPRVARPAAPQGVPVAAVAEPVPPMAEEYAEPPLPNGRSQRIPTMAAIQLPSGDPVPLPRRHPQPAPDTPGPRSSARQTVALHHARPGSGPGGWIPEERRASFQIGQTGLMVITIGLIAVAYFVASTFLFK